jgi:hypothetical protein
MDQQRIDQALVELNRPRAIAPQVSSKVHAQVE